MKHRNKMKKLARRQKAFDSGPKDSRDAHRWSTLLSQKGVHRPGSVNK